MILTRNIEILISSCFKYLSGIFFCGIILKIKFNDKKSAVRIYRFLTFEKCYKFKSGKLIPSISRLCFKQWFILFLCFLSYRFCTLQKSYIHFRWETMSTGHTELSCFFLSIYVCCIGKGKFTWHFFVLDIFLSFKSFYTN